MILHLTSAQVNELRSHAASTAGSECCGILIGLAEREHLRVLEVHPTANAWEPPRPDRYLIDPREHLRLACEARERGLTIVGFYHSHAHAPAKPSAYDQRLAWPGPCYLIIAGQEIRAWRFESDSYCEVQVIVEEAQTGP